MTEPLPEPMVVYLDWPPAALSPNARGHWSKRAKAAKQYRADCHHLTLISKIKVDWPGAVYLCVTFYPPDKRSRDDDNLIAGFKAGRDGIADALGIDDKRFIVHHRIGAYPEKGGKVRVALSKEPF